MGGWEGREFCSVSPRRTIARVETRKPTRPPASVDMRIEVMEMTATFPNKSVQRSRFPFLRTGMMRLAHRAASGSAPGKGWVGGWVDKEVRGWMG